MSVLKATSWGRTRRPKAPSNQDKNLITGSTGLAALNILSEEQFTATNGCYQTENQRYAHLMCSGSSTITNVYLYNYASGYWHELKHVDPADGSTSAVAVGNNEHIIVDIYGADWISIKSGSNSAVTMAFSTF